MGAKAVDALGNVHAAEGLAPGNGIRLVARLDRQCVWSLDAPSDEPIYRFLDVNEWLLHRCAKVGCRTAARKQ